MQLSYYIDYDRPELPGLSYHERISYLENRLQRILLKPLNEMLDRITHPLEDYSPILIYANAICCAIESMGKFLNGNINLPSNSVFKDFIQKYMHPDFSTKRFNGQLYMEILWADYRNGIAHCFYIKNGGLEVMSQNFRLHNDKCYPMLEIEPEFLLRDFESGVNKYLDDLRKANLPDAIAVNFMKIFNDLYILGK